MQCFSYLAKREVFLPEYSQPPILPSPHFRWVVNEHNPHSVAWCAKGSVKVRSGANVAGGKLVLVGENSAKSCSELFGAARSCSELLGAARSRTSISELLPPPHSASHSVSLWGDKFYRRGRYRGQLTLYPI